MDDTEAILICILLLLALCIGIGCCIARKQTETLIKRTESIIAQAEDVRAGVLNQQADDLEIQIWRIHAAQIRAVGGGEAPAAQGAEPGSGMALPSQAESADHKAREGV
jgi:uncharacterized protein HemX